jgi:hypothetical protein
LFFLPIDVDRDSPLEFGLLFRLTNHKSVPRIVKRDWHYSSDLLLNVDPLQILINDVDLRDYA